MDAVQALADLTEISSQVHQVAILDSDGTLLAATAREPVRAERFVASLMPLLDEATTRSDPTVGLIFYDLKHCLGSIDGAVSPSPKKAANGSGQRAQAGRRRRADTSA